MAKRRNAPALFELLRETNSTRTGQVGNEEMRAQIGAGSVRSAAPKPPHHPDVVAAREAAKKAGESSAKQDASVPIPTTTSEAKVARPDLATAAGSSDEVLEIKRDTKLDIGGVDDLLSMPSFKAVKSAGGGQSSSKPSFNGGSATPARQASRPTSERSKPTHVKSSGQAAPSVKSPETKLPESPKSSAIKPKKPRDADPKPVKHQASSLESQQKSHGAARAGGNVVETKPESKADTKKATEGAASPGSGPVASAVAGPAGGSPGAAGSRFSGMEFTPVKLGLFGAFGVLLVFAIFVVAYSLGKSDAKEEIVPQLSEQAGNTLAGVGADQGGAGSPAQVDDKPVDPLLITRDEQFVPPIPEEGQGTGATEASGDADTERETGPGAGGLINPATVTNEDTRETGDNYMHLAPIADQEEARRLQIFLAEHGIGSFIRTTTRGGREVYEPILMVGIPSDGFRTSTEKIGLEREIERLGGIWFDEHGGSIDYSRANQRVWYKAP